ncbi:S-layer homology domain-containing protein, partial [Flavonifractor plautii]|uniref:S-layer homology domain-containing protein n=1 Tax=Flavonifractor plautii TaxID=292800 RepID=UPI00210E9A15
PDDAGAPARFQDTASISGWAAESVEEMRRCGLREGDSAGRMNPARPVTRAEGVTLFMRLTKQLQAAGAEVGLDGPATPAALEDITFTVERTEMAVGDRQQLTYGFPMGAVVPGP